MADGTTKDLTTLTWKWAEAGSGKPAVGKNYSGGPLKVSGKVYAKGVGTHANSVIGYDLPADVVGFRAKVAIDDGGAIRNGKPSNADVRFMVFTEAPGKLKLVDFDAGPTLLDPQMFTVPEGFEVTVWATSPQIFNPTNIDF
ncbi:MAG: dehydrogenase, partial [Verrucomicrobia bacterium]|nr:dehydrogenase [Verrucomicrobiota bacterium]